MKSKEEYKKIAYDKAEDMSCNVDCARYRQGTCLARHNNKLSCYRFKESYDYYRNSLEHNDCISEHEIAHCNECVSRDNCLIAEVYDWNLM